MKELYFHEDDYCQVELLPMNLFQHCSEEMRKIDEFSAAHWNGTAWSAMYMREDHSEKLRSLGIRISDISDKLNSTLERVERILTGYGSYQELCSDTSGWVFPCECALLINYAKDDVIQNIWLVNEPPELESIDKFKEAVAVLTEYSELVIADWRKGILVPCSDEEKLRRYFSRSFDHFHSLT